MNDLNNWLKENITLSGLEYSKKERERNYYVNKLIELEENQLQTIKV